MERRFIMMKQTFMKLNLSCRLFLIIIVLFLIPYLSLFPGLTGKRRSLSVPKLSPWKKKT